MVQVERCHTYTRCYHISCTKLDDFRITLACLSPTSEFLAVFEEKIIQDSLPWLTILSRRERFLGDLDCLSGLNQEFPYFLLGSVWYFLICLGLKGSGSASITLYQEWLFRLLKITIGYTGMAENELNRSYLEASGIKNLSRFFIIPQYSWWVFGLMANPSEFLWFVHNSIRLKSKSFEI